jgi:iron-sulfur cluster repair protein YtfE (RIC family)
MRDYEECRTYIDHLAAEHRRLHNMIRNARFAMIHSAGADHDATPADVNRVLTQMRDELAHHFREEEGGGCMDEAVSRCPRLSGDVRRIESEHPELLARLDALIVAAADIEKSVRHRVEFEADLDNFCRQICAHEAAENEILRQAFGYNVNGDNGTPALASVE